MIFILKGSLTALAAIIVHQILIYVHVVTNFFALHALSTLFLAFGFVGVFLARSFCF